MTRSHCCQFSAHYEDWFKMTGIPSHMYTQMVNYRFNSMERTGAKNTNLGKMWEGEYNEKDWQLLIVLPWLNVSLNGTGKRETRLENERPHRGNSLLQRPETYNTEYIILKLLGILLKISEHQPYGIYVSLCETTWCWCCKYVPGCWSWWDPHLTSTFR